MNIPDNAFVSGLEILIGEKRYYGKVVRKEEAEKMFAEAVAQGKTAGLLQSRGTREFAVTMNTGAGIKATFDAVYEEYLTRRL